MKERLITVAFLIFNRLILTTQKSMIGLNIKETIVLIELISTNLINKIKSNKTFRAIRFQMTTRTVYDGAL